MQVASDPTSWATLSILEGLLETIADIRKNKGSAACFTVCALITEKFTQSTRRAALSLPGANSGLLLPAVYDLCFVHT